MRKGEDYGRRKRKTFFSSFSFEKKVEMNWKFVAQNLNFALIVYVKSDCCGECSGECSGVLPFSVVYFSLWLTRVIHR